jgi:hypothetical protein
MRLGDESGLRWRHGGQLDAESPDPMGDVTPSHRRLAGAYLALGDDPEPPLGQRSVPRAVGALAAAITLALAAPLAWAAAGPDRVPADQPAATQTGKAAPAQPADDDDGDA